MRLKLNETAYKKLLAQAEEAKEQGMVKLANGIYEAIGPMAADENQEYSYTQLKDDIHLDMWKMASRFMIYYDLNSVDAEKVNQTILRFAEAMTSDLEKTLKVESILKGPLEPKVFGEKWYIDSVMETKICKTYGFTEELYSLNAKIHFIDGARQTRHNKGKK